jgi:hypothetical protein
MRLKLLFIVSTFLILTYTFLFAAENVDSAKVQKACQASLDKLTKSLNKHKFSIIEPLLAENFAYSGLGCGGYCNANVEAMKMVVAGYKYKINKITIDDMKSEAIDYRLSLTYYLEKNEPEKLNALMTSDGKFLELTLPKVKLMVRSASDTTSTQGTNCNKQGCGH